MSEWSCGQLKEGTQIALKVFVMDSKLLSTGEHRQHQKNERGYTTIIHPDQTLYTPEQM